MSKSIKTNISDNEHKTLVTEADRLGKKRERFYGLILGNEAGRIEKRNAREATNENE